MTREQRFRYEMFVRVRDFGAAHAGRFPESSKIGRAFARVADEAAAIEAHRTHYFVGMAKARRVKAATRAAVFNYLKTLALAARRLTRPDVKENPFRVPRKRNLERELATARAFIEQARARQDEFIEFGLPPTFLSELTTLVNNLQQAVDGRLASRAMRRKATHGVQSAIARGFEVVRDLDALLALALRDEPDTYAAWGAARRVEGTASSSRTTRTAAGTATPPAGSAASVDAPAGEPAPVAEAQVPTGSAPAPSADTEPSTSADAWAPAEPAPARVPPLQQVMGRAS